MRGKTQMCEGCDGAHGDMHEEDFVADVDTGISIKIVLEPAFFCGIFLFSGGMCLWDRGTG